VKGRAEAGVLLLTPRVFGDERGFFLESWNQRTFDEAVGRLLTFVQAKCSHLNHSFHFFLKLLK
jgi:dTDP-4-dehydrorhamnose 3,5-epimerase-like enzyme